MQEKRAWRINNNRTGGSLYVPLSALDAASSDADIRRIVWLYRRAAWSEQIFAWRQASGAVINVPLGRGDVFATLRYLSEAWSEGVGAIRGFLARMESAGVLTTVRHGRVAVVRLLGLADADGKARDEARAGSTMKQPEIAQSTVCNKKENGKFLKSSDSGKSHKSDQAIKTNQSPLPPKGGRGAENTGNDIQEAVALFTATASRWGAPEPVLTRRRTRRMADRLREAGIDGWRKVLDSAARSPFVLRIKPGLDFFLSPETFPKLAAGEWERGSKPSPVAAPALQAKNAPTLRAAIDARIGRPAAAAWLNATSIAEADDGVSITAKTQFAAAQIAERYGAAIRAAASGRPVRILSAH